jgi:PhzF family phenazine biosynthesis protein
VSDPTDVGRLIEAGFDNSSQAAAVAVEVFRLSADMSDDARDILVGRYRVALGFQPLWMKAGREQLIIPLTSEAAVKRARPAPALFEKLKCVDGAGQAYVFATTGAKKILSRFFFPDNGAILEDPATGSACANLGGWFVAMGRRPPLNFEVAQGEFIGRPSTLQLEVNADNEVFVGGEVIEIGSGILNL